MSKSYDTHQTLSNEAIADSLINQLLQLGNMLHFMERRQASTLDLTALQLSILKQCKASEMNGEITYATSLVEKLMITAATLSASMATLEQKKLLYRRQDANDKRKFLIQLSEAGHRKAEVSMLSQKPLKDILKPLPAEQIELLRQQLKAITQKLKELLS